MNAYDLADIRRRLEPHGITAELKLADNIWHPMAKYVRMPGVTTCELRGPRGWAMIHRSPEGLLYACWRNNGTAGLSGIRPDSMDQCLESIMAVIS